jgi:cell division protein FtsL
MKKYEHQGESNVGKQRRQYGYVEGSAVRNSARYTDMPQAEFKQIKNYKVKPVPMNKGYIFVMAISIVWVCIVLMSYVKLQSEMTNHISNISSLESELNEKKLSNDETYTKIMSSVDLEEIKRIAVQELGMKYAKEGQVIEYEGEGNDYVRQYRDIPE